jgi:integrase/recombinase XerD
MANKRLKALRAIFAWGGESLDLENPTIGVKLAKSNSSGHHSWSMQEVHQFEERHPVGSMARLALSLLLYTACRREDVIRFGPQHISNGRLKYTQAKNEHRNPVHMDIPVHPDLTAIIAKTQIQHLTFLTTERGNPFSNAYFGNWFRRRCNEAGLQHCSAHGLRKATAARLAERGATPHEIMAITGHKNLREVERYTRAVQQAGLADSAMKKFKT